VGRIEKLSAIPQMSRSRVLEKMPSPASTTITPLVTNVALTVRRPLM
jgi:hypothetical protein